VDFVPLATCENAAGARLTQGPSCDLIQVIEERVVQIYDSILKGLVPAVVAVAPARVADMVDLTVVDKLALQDAHGAASGESSFRHVHDQATF
jgi:hypothetical protein